MNFDHDIDTIQYKNKIKSIYVFSYGPKASARFSKRFEIGIRRSVVVLKSSHEHSIYSITEF